jgi:hypothetical protein
MNASKRRRDHRVDTNYSATLRDTSGQKIDAYILNVSRSGFRLSTNQALAVGDSVMIRTKKNQDHPGVIRWADGTEAGGTFLTPARLPDEFGYLKLG